MKQNPSIQQKRPQQIIIKFKDNVSDPSRAEFVKELSRAVKASLFYVRPMSGGAHVFRVETGDDTVNIEDIIKRLSKRPDVVYVEQDAVMIHH